MWLPNQTLWGATRYIIICCFVCCTKFKPTKIFSTHKQVDYSQLGGGATVPPKCLFTLKYSAQSGTWYAHIVTVAVPYRSVVFNYRSNVWFLKLPIFFSLLYTIKMTVKINVCLISHCSGLKLTIAFFRS